MSETQAPRAPARQRVPRRPPAEIPIARADLDGLLQRLESRQAALRLAQALELDTPELAAAPGRLALFHEAFAARPDLFTAALLGDMPRMLNEWAAYLKTQAGNARCWHSLAALWRERLVHFREGWTSGDWERFSSLWLWLMCSASLWEYFGAERQRPSDSEPRGSLPVAEKRELFEWAVTDSLQIHRVEGGKAFSSGATDVAAIHFRCLRGARGGEPELRRALSRAGWEPELVLDAELLAFASGTAAKLLADWEREVLEKAADLAHRQEYAAVIALLEPYAGMAGGSLPVFIAILDAHLQSAEVEQKSKHLEFARVPESAKSAVQKLESMTDPNRPLDRENLLLVKYYLLRGLATKDASERMELADSALKWNNEHGDAQAMYLYGRINSQNSLDGAVQILRECEQRGFNPGLIASARRELASLESKASRS